MCRVHIVSKDAYDSKVQLNPFSLLTEVWVSSFQSMTKSFRMVGRVFPSLFQTLYFIKCTLGSTYLQREPKCCLRGSHLNYYSWVSIFPSSLHNSTYNMSHLWLIVMCFNVLQDPCRWAATPSNTDTGFLSSLKVLFRINYNWNRHYRKCFRVLPETSIWSRTLCARLITYHCILATINARSDLSWRLLHWWIFSNVTMFIV